jgi:hypothetical protein
VDASGEIAIAGCPLKKKACGVDAACNCGAPVVPAFKRAADAIEADPTKSNRQIAEEIGVSEGLSVALDNVLQTQHLTTPPPSTIRPRATFGMIRGRDRPRARSHEKALNGRK